MTLKKKISYLQETVVQEKNRIYIFNIYRGSSGGSDGKESACNAGDPGSIPESRTSLGDGTGNPSSLLAWKIPWIEEPGGL